MKILNLLVMIFLMGCGSESSTSGKACPKYVTVSANEAWNCRVDTDYWGILTFSCQSGTAACHGADSLIAFGGVENAQICTCKSSDITQIIKSIKTFTGSTFKCDCPGASETTMVISCVGKLNL